MSCPFSAYPALHSFVGDVGSSSNIPSFNSSSGLGRCCSFCSRLSARICFCNSFCWPCIAGAALESGRMFPKPLGIVSQLYVCIFCIIDNFGQAARYKFGDFVRSINSSLSGRFSNPFLRLSVACWRSSSNWADCKALGTCFLVSSSP